MDTAYFFNNIKGVIENFVEYSILTQVLALLKFLHVPVEYTILCYSGRRLTLPNPRRRNVRVCTSVGSRLRHQMTVLIVVKMK